MSISLTRLPKMQNILSTKRTAMSQERVIDDIKDLLVTKFGVRVTNGCDLRSENFFGQKIKIRASDLIYMVYALEERYGVILDQTCFLSDGFFSVDDFSRCFAACIDKHSASL